MEQGYDEEGASVNQLGVVPYDASGFNRARMAGVSCTGAPKRWRLRTLACLVLLAVIAAACSGEAPARAVGTPADSSAPAVDPSVTRSANDPEEQDVFDNSETETAGESIQVEGSADVVHVLGSVRVAPEGDTDWVANIPVVLNDLATVASLSCDQGVQCDPNQVAAWAEERVEILNLATSANVLSQEELAHRAGIDRTFVSGCERLVRNPTLTTVEKIAAGLEVDPAEMFKVST